MASSRSSHALPRPAAPAFGFPPGQFALGAVVAVLALAAGSTLLPLWLPLVFAAWFAHLARPLHLRLSGWLRGKARAAAIVAVLLVIAVLSPIVIVALSLAGDAATLITRLREAESAAAALRSVAVPDGDAGARDLGSLLSAEPERIVELVREHGTSALGFAAGFAGATAAVVLGLVIFVGGFYVFLVDGPRLGAWLARNQPLSRRQFRRLSGAFYETGRGLIVGVGLTALVQGAVAGVGYTVVRVPHALVLGLLTAAAVLIPTVGSALVWGPVAAILMRSDRVGAGVAILCVGAVVGLADNFLRPLLSRFGRLRLPTFVLLCRHARWNRNLRPRRSRGGPALRAARDGGAPPVARPSPAHPHRSGPRVGGDSRRAGLDSVLRIEGHEHSF